MDSLIHTHSLVAFTCILKTLNLLSTQTYLLNSNPMFFSCLLDFST